MGKRNALIAYAFLFIVFIILLAASWMTEQYLLISFGIILSSILVLLVRFESRKIDARELVLIAVLAAIAAVSRIPFASIPSVQPATFVIMMAGLVFGAESGLIIGAVAALASNMVLGQGPWTPWQMIAWGLVGLTAGLLRNKLNSIWGKLIFGALWGFLFGWIMNLWGLFSLTQSGNILDFKAIFVYFSASAIFDTMHSLSNIIFILLFGGAWYKLLMRFKRKYGLLDH